MPRKITPSVLPGNKWCHACRRELRVEAFTSDKSKADGLCSKCRGCAERQRQVRQEINTAMAETFTRLSGWSFAR